MVKMMIENKLKLKKKYDEEYEIKKMRKQAEK